MRVFPLILCGGSGERLWPLSRQSYPKQFVSFFGKHSLFQDTVLRVCHESHEAPLIICNEEHRFLIADQLAAINVDPMAILLEPVGRNTAPAIITAAQYVQNQVSEAILTVFPSDHLIKNLTSFKKTLDQAIAAAKENHLITFGICPTRPEIGYGYIKKGRQLSSAGLAAVEKFIEKPDAKRAQEYLDKGGYYWNSGMFVFHLSTFLKEAKSWLPEVVSGCQKALGDNKGPLIKLDRKIFPSIPSVSIDYGIMEKTDKAVVIESSFDWTDLGSYESLWEFSERNGAENAVQGRTILEDVEGCYVFSRGPLTAVVGVKDLVIVSTKDTVLVAKREESQKIKKLVERLKEESQLESTNSMGYRPWGTYQLIDQGEGFQVKRIIVKPGGILSLQKHQHRSEHWVVTKGVAHVINGDQSLELKANESTYIAAGTLHRLENKGPEPLHLIEVQCGAYLGEDDIERLEDIYGRV